jgi:hypothetical protein
MPWLMMFSSSRTTLPFGLAPAVILASMGLFAAIALWLAFSSLALLIVGLIFALVAFAMLIWLIYNLITGR